MTGSTMDDAVIFEVVYSIISTINTQKAAAGCMRERTARERELGGKLCREVVGRIVSKFIRISPKPVFKKRFLVCKTIPCNLRVCRFVLILRAGAPFNFHKWYDFYIHNDSYLFRHHFPSI